MKKGVKYSFLLMLFMIIINVKGVTAAESLICLYEEGTGLDSTPGVMLVQDSSGKIEFFVNYYGDYKKSDDSDWYNPKDTDKITLDFDTDYYSNGSLSKCPKYSRDVAGLFESGYHYAFADDDHWWYADHELYKEIKEEIDPNDYQQTFEGDYDDEISKHEWIGTCKYDDGDGSSKTTLYFNREKMIIAENSSLISKIYANFSLNELLEVYDEIGTCPTLHAKNDCYAVIGNSFCTVSYDLDKSFWNSDTDAPGGDSDINIDNDPEAPNTNTDIEELDKCSSLLGDPNQTNPATPAYYMSVVFSVIRYVAIILLIVLTTMDFVGAVASQDNDILKKAVTKVIKRAILCVIIFLLPTLINFILQFVHNVQIHDCINYNS